MNINMSVQITLKRYRDKVSMKKGKKVKQFDTFNLKGKIDKK